jgi:hypothetical protein
MAASRAAFSAGTRGSAAPDRMSTGVPSRRAAGGSASGTMARIRTAPASASGRSSMTAAATLAPLEKPSAIGAGRS